LVVLSDPVLIIGGGPAGLSAAACLKMAGIPFRLIDRRGVLGGAYNEIRSDLVLNSPRRYSALPGLAPVAGGEYITAGEIRAYLDKYVQHFALSAERREVVSVQREADGFVVRFADGEEARAPFVVVATGMWDNPVRPTIPGLESAPVVHAKEWKGPPASGRVLVIGGATTGIEIAEECARAGLSVVVSTRTGVQILPQRFLGRDLHDFGRFADALPLWLFTKRCDRRFTLPGTDLGYGDLKKAGKIRERGAVARFEGARAIFEQGEPEELEQVVLATGYAFAMPFLGPEVARATAGHPRTKKNESTTVSGLFFVGTPCAGAIASEFLRGVAVDAPRVAEAIGALLRGRPRLLGASALAAAFLVIHGAALHWDLASMLWCCNVATALIALGLAAGSPRLNALGFLWFTIGIPCWVIDELHGGHYHWTTWLTHVGGLALGAVGVRTLGMPRGSWWRAMLGLIALQQFSKLVTPASENVNLAYGVHETAIGLPYPLYYALVTIAFSTTFFMAEWLSRRLASGSGRAPARGIPSGTTASP
jgi:putative flavoprotein involved in K+ transport